MLDALTKAGFNTETLRRGNRKTNNVDVTLGQSHFWVLGQMPAALQTI